MIICFCHLVLLDFFFLSYLLTDKADCNCREYSDAKVWCSFVLQLVESVTTLHNVGMKKSHCWSLKLVLDFLKKYTQLSHKPDCWCRISVGSVAGRFRRFLWCDCQFKWARTSWDDRQLNCCYFKRQKDEEEISPCPNYEPAGLKVKDSVLFKGPKERRMSLGPKKWNGHWFWGNYKEVSTMFFITFPRIKED